MSIIKEENILKKSILFLIPNLKHGGAEKVLVNLANNMEKSKYNVTVMTLFDVGVNKKNLLPHVNYCSFMKKEFRGNSYVFKCFSPAFWWKKIVKQHYDIVVSYLEGPTARIVSGCTDPCTKTVSWLHIELTTPKLASQGFRTVKEAKIAYEKFDKIVAVSKNVKECFSENLKVKNSIEILYNTNETEQIRNMSEIPIDNHKFTKDDNILKVCSVAKLMKTKGFDRLLEVHKKLLNDGVRHKVYILGIGEEQSYLERKIKEYGLDETFYLLGFQKNPYQYVKKCDLYICSSRREGFSTAVTEALILGVPVVSTDCSGTKELLGDNNEYGIVVENSTKGIYQGMKRMLEDSKLRMYYKERAQIRGNYFSREKTVKAVEKMFDSL